MKVDLIHLNDVIEEIDEERPDLAKKLGMDLSDHVLGYVQTSKGEVAFTFHGNASPGYAAYALFGFVGEESLDADEYADYFLTSRAGLFSSVKVKGGYYKWAARRLDKAFEILDSTLEEHKPEAKLRRLEVQYDVVGKGKIEVNFYLYLNRGVAEYNFISDLIKPGQFKIRYVSQARHYYKAIPIIFHYSQQDRASLVDILNWSLRGKKYVVGETSAIANDIDLAVLRYMKGYFSGDNL